MNDVKRYNLDVCGPGHLISAFDVVAEENSEGIWVTHADYATLRSRIEELEAMLYRAYTAGNKPAWEEGECWNEVSLDVRFALCRCFPPDDDDSEHVLGCKFYKAPK